MERLPRPLRQFLEGSFIRNVGCARHAAFAYVAHVGSEFATCYVCSWPTARPIEMKYGDGLGNTLTVNRMCETCADAINLIMAHDLPVLVAWKGPETCHECEEEYWKTTTRLDSLPVSIHLLVCGYLYPRENTT